MKRLFTAFMIAASLVLHSGASAAGLVTFEREYRYEAGKTDNLVSCRMIALEQVKRLLLEELGTYLESSTEVRNFSLTRDKITVLTAGIVRATIIEEKWDTRVYYLKARVAADPDDVTRKIDALRRDRRKSEDLTAARKLYDAAHLALRAGKIDDAEKLLVRLVREYPHTEYATTGKDQLAQFALIRQFNIQQLDNLAQASLKKFRTLLEAYFADWMRMPSTLHDLKQASGDPGRLLAAGVQLLYLRQNRTPQEYHYTLYAFHESGQKVYVVRSEDAAVNETDKKSGILAALKKDYQVLETAGPVTILGMRQERNTK
jgi:predicted Zn-dependent protease